MKLTRQCLRPDEIPADSPITSIGTVIPFGQRVENVVIYTFVTALIVAAIMIVALIGAMVGEKVGKDEGYHDGRRDAIWDCGTYGLHNGCKPKSRDQLVKER